MDPKQTMQMLAEAYVEMCKDYLLEDGSAITKFEDCSIDMNHARSHIRDHFEDIVLDFQAEVNKLIDKMQIVAKTATFNCDGLIDVDLAVIID